MERIRFTNKRSLGILKTQQRKPIDLQRQRVHRKCLLRADQTTRNIAITRRSETECAVISDHIHKACVSTHKGFNATIA